MPVAQKARPVSAATKAPAATRSFSLHERAMLVSLNLSRWPGTTADSETTAEVLTTKKADNDAGKFSKVLVTREDLFPITVAFNKARAMFRRLTLPWDEGVGILKSENWMSFQEQMNQCKDACMAVTATFVRDGYPKCRASAPQRMGKLFDPKDWPTADEIRSRFGFRLTVLPIPDKQDFRVDLGKEAVTAIRQGIEHHITEKVQEAQQTLWTRVLDVLKHFAETMKDPTAKFKDATIENLATIAKEAVALTVTPDPQLATICAELQTMAKAQLPDTLRTDEKARDKAAKDAAAAVARIERIMKGAF